MSDHIATSFRSVTWFLSFSNFDLCSYLLDHFEIILEHYSFHLFFEDCLLYSFIVYRDVFNLLFLVEVVSVHVVFLTIQKEVQGGGSNFTLLPLRLLCVMFKSRVLAFWGILSLLSPSTLIWVFSFLNATFPFPFLLSCDSHPSRFLLSRLCPGEGTEGSGLKAQGWVLGPLRSHSGSGYSPVLEEVRPFSASARFSRGLPGFQWTPAGFLRFSFGPVSASLLPTCTHTDGSYSGLVALGGWFSSRIFWCQWVHFVTSLCELLCFYVAFWEDPKTFPQLPLSSQDSLPWTFLMPLSLLGTPFVQWHCALLILLVWLIHSLCLSGLVFHGSFTSRMLVLLKFYSFLFNFLNLFYLID